MLSPVLMVEMLKKPARPTCGVGPVDSSGWRVVRMCWGTGVLGSSPKAEGESFSGEAKWVTWRWT